MKSIAKNQSLDQFQLPFHNVRHISSPEDLSNNRKVYIGQAPIYSIVDLPTDENVRGYLLEAEGKVRKVPGQVHRAIKDTLVNNPENFSVMNSGVTIVARNCEIDEAKKILKLSKPSIINGSQTQGVIKDFLKENDFDNIEKDYPYNVKFEIIVTDNEDLIAEISIARNFQNDVMTISIVGRLGQLDELEKNIQKHLPESKLKTSETKLSDDYIKTEKLLQVIAALIPKELWPNKTEFNKVFTYAMKTKCLKLFQEVYKKAKDPSDPDHVTYRELYQFYLDIAAQALEIYDKWKKHQGFKGTRLRAIERDEKKNITNVPDGIIFPIISSFSVFAKKTKNGWEIFPPTLFSEEELIKTAAYNYIEVADSNPNVMGKTKACYSGLYQITEIYKKLTSDYV